MDDLIARARKLDTTATSGPWARECTGQGNAVFCLDKNITPPGLRLEDANFIAQSRTLLPALADALEAVRKRAAEQGDVLRKVAAAFNGWANGSNQGDLATLTALEMIGAALGDPLKGQQP